MAEAEYNKLFDEGEEENVEENEPEIVEDEITENELPENVEVVGYNDGDDEEINNAENTQSINPNAENTEYVENIVYDDDDNADELDEEALRTFMLQLFQLQKQNIVKKKESCLIPSKIDVDVSPGDRNVMEYIINKHCPAKDKRFTLVEDMCIHGYIRKAVQQLD
ncbi:Hypothetical predicted protein [Paramuricea clavata]|uniref:Uncharacterized protein n=1 Tax=Paramuricea clavata TaxID=317549 RepID=A0A6S7FUS2_PARCT|nr:Hypothetical predicted protein [Paramuricea clavata]